MKLVIMFCNIPQIEVYTIPQSINDIEEYIEEYLHLDADEISWQLYEGDDDITVKFIAHA